MLRDAQGCSPSAQVKAAAAHVQTLKRNQRKKKLSLTYLVVILSFEPCLAFSLLVPWISLVTGCRVKKHAELVLDGVRLLLIFAQEVDFNPGKVLTFFSDL